MLNFVRNYIKMPILNPKYPLIVADIAFCDGKPRISNTRITISAILSYLAGGMSIEKLLIAFPQLNNEAITQALSFAAEQFQETYFPLKAA
jgi:uncharacterized protein (DUF433 family)